MKKGWLCRKALDHESFNFLSYVQTYVEEKQNSSGKAQGVATGNEHVVMFEDLIPPGTQSVMVAAQAFLHVLSLATKGALGVTQEEQEFGGTETTDGRSTRDGAVTQIALGRAFPRSITRQTLDGS